MLSEENLFKGGRLVNVRISEGDYKKLEMLVKQGDFLNISDAVRYGIRLLIEKYLSEEGKSRGDD